MPKSDTPNSYTRIIQEFMDHDLSENELEFHPMPVSNEELYQAVRHSAIRDAQLHQFFESVFDEDSSDTEDESVEMRFFVPTPPEPVEETEEPTPKFESEETEGTENPTSDESEVDAAQAAVDLDDDHSLSESEIK